jgi:uncharacterized protein (DUF2267 family)
MTYDELVGEIQRRGGLEARDDAARVLAVTARVLGERLFAEEADAIAVALPAEVARELSSTRYERDFDVDELYDRVARREATRHGFGMEHAQAVLQVIGESLPEATRLRLQKHLPAEMAALFEPRAHELAPPRPVHASPPVEPGQGSTLATGRPGSRHPVSDTPPVDAHRHSVARSQDPHADTKLSSSPGLTQERLGDSLAEARPGPAHPVSDTKR